MNLLRLFRKQEGTALVMVMGILAVLTISGTTMMAYTSSNTKTSARSKSDESSFSLSEAALNNAMAVLSNPSNNALDPDLLPATEATAQSANYENGTAKWYGVLDRSTAVWAVTAIGLTNNPTGAASAQVRRKLTAKVPVTPNQTQPANSPAWNYIFNRRTGNTCDMTIQNNVTGQSRLYVAGNLCLDNNAAITSEAMIVRGNLDLLNNAQVGANTSMATRVETYVGGNCRYGGGSWATPCTGNQDSRRIYSKKDPPSYIVGVNNVAPLIPEPAADWATWYENSIPGPAQSCTSVSGTPPTFDTNYPIRDNSVSTVFELTPASSYTCRVGPAGSPSGELSWNASTKVLTVAGTIFIDGSAKVTNNALNQYNGQATLYLSGTFVTNNSTRLCGGISAGNCDFSAWNPNTEMLTIVTNGSGGLAGIGNGFKIDNNSYFQGGAFATYDVEYTNNARSDGPIVGREVKFSNNVQNDQFPTITVVPVGMPGNPIVYAQPNPPQMFAG
jgi:hypothetical protein